MTTQELLERAYWLEEKIRKAPETARLDLLPEFSRILSHIKDAGAMVPGHLKRMELSLLDDAVERRFDNMPI